MKQPIERLDYDIQLRVDCTLEEPEKDGGEK